MAPHTRLAAIYDRRAAAEDQLSAGAYNLVIGLCLLWGFLLTTVIVSATSRESLQHLGLAGALAGLTAAISGAYLFHYSSRPLVSFIGHNLVIVPMGLAVSLLVHGSHPDAVYAAIRATALVSLLMMAFATLAPGWFRAIGTTITVALAALVAVKLIESLLLGIHHDLLDWAVAAVLCGYIGLDWARANAAPRTLDNAIDCAAEIYVDIVVLFLRVLRVLSPRNTP